ncbi:hypothetical protein [Rhodococcus aetherivorans]|uniref:hypothetical protein n=1 Tax=Rhodococcus aetherivorans TaxID=191292 RepID=UPI00163A6F22|nr:hypothetical protein [Rhodococcus aetherivorans]MBC2592511.1 hypothetical protein [Rhodococcus aetherivorans]
MRGRKAADSGFGPDRTGAVDADQPAREAIHDDARHGTSTLFAALDIATGNGTGLRVPRHRPQTFSTFLKHLTRAYPERELHLVMDNDATHKKGPKSGRGGLTILVFVCISRPPRLMDGPCGGVVRNNRTADHPPRTFGSIKELTTSIRAFINGWDHALHAVRLNQHRQASTYQGIA